MKKSQMNMLLIPINSFMSNGKKNAYLVRNKKTKTNILLQDKVNFTKIISYLREKVTFLNSKLNGKTKSVRMLNYGYEILDEIIGVGKVSRDMTGIGFYYNYMNDKNYIVPSKQKTELLMIEYM